MKLSEAIRLGSMLLPPTGGAKLKVFERDTNDVPFAACALGAAGFAVGITRNIMRASAGEDCEMVRYWPHLVHPTEDPTLVGGPRLFSPLAYVISTLYECMGWTREQIADWVATVEPPALRAEAAQQEVVPEVASGENHEMREAVYCSVRRTT